MKCHRCGEAIDIEAGQKVAKSEECPQCYADVRCCKMCVFYDTTVANSCREPSAQRVFDKEKSNFCDFFRLGGGPSGPGARDSKDEILAKAESLFKKG